MGGKSSRVYITGPGLQLIFCRKIDDDGYLHGLRIWEDRVTGAVRLQASVHGGPMGRTPVWTAFITHNIGKEKWIRTEDSRTVVLRHVRPMVFMSGDDYNSPRNNYGHIIEFKTSSDASDFLDVIRGLATGAH
ncbi:unnamed protein product [Penicillium salamii]|nr:unnamed protein product [Penicillium salamii]CAG8415294.1 unnamed protein product [Penicillium salamii]